MIQSQAFPAKLQAGDRLSNHLASSNSTDLYNTISSELYPWALTGKERRTLTDSCTIHLIDESNNIQGNKLKQNYLFAQLRGAGIEHPQTGCKEYFNGQEL